MLAYDYIILGSGAAGLSLAHRFAEAPLNQYNVLIIDKEIKNSNDRTWCSWVMGNDKYDHLAVKHWNEIIVTDTSGESWNLPLAPYKYRMIRSADFYRHINQALEKATNIDLLTDTVISIEEKDGQVLVHTTTNTYAAAHLFRSNFDIQIDKTKEMYVDQHFKGWFIETTEAMFDDAVCKLMDFSIDQKDEVRFMYVLPIDKYNALVEVAIFSNQILAQEEYDTIIKDYIRDQLKIAHYVIRETEFGIIPMTMHDFTKYSSSMTTGIGAMAGAVKPSTGYAFTRIQEHIDAVADCIKDGRSPNAAQIVFKSKYKLYDATMMDVVFRRKHSGASFFYSLFKNSGAPFVFKFLDEKTTLWEETRAMMKMDWINLGWSFILRLISK